MIQNVVVSIKCTCEIVAEKLQSYKRIITSFRSSLPLLLNVLYLFSSSSFHLMITIQQSNNKSMKNPLSNVISLLENKQQQQ